MPGGLEVTSEDGCGVWVLGCECRDVVADVKVLGDGSGVMTSREVGANEEYGGGARGADENRGDAS